MTYKVKTTKRFDKDLKRCERRGYNMQLIFSLNLWEAWCEAPNDRFRFIGVR